MAGLATLDPTKGAFAFSPLAGRKNLDMQPRAIETRYKGYRFRSRLEARWAVFFDALGLRWEYEPEGFELPSGRYLPDFYLPQYGLWVEVKATSATAVEIAKARELMESKREPVFITCGMPDAAGTLFYGYTQLGGEFNSNDMPAPFDVLQWGWNPNPLGFWVYGSTPNVEQHDHNERLILVGGTDAVRRVVTPVVERAIEAARSARFEHGESGAR